MNYDLVTFCIKYTRRSFKDLEVDLLNIEEMNYLKEISRKYFTAQEVSLIIMCVIKDHVHMLFQSEDLNTLKQRIGKFKGYSSVLINRNFRYSEKGKGKQSTLWAQRYNIRFINSKSHYLNVIRYIKTNENHHKFIE